MCLLIHYEARQVGLPTLGLDPVFFSLLHTGDDRNPDPGIALAGVTQALDPTLAGRSEKMNHDC